MFKIFSKSKLFICIFAFVSICLFSSCVSAFSITSDYYNNSTQSWLPMTYNFGNLLGIEEGKSPKTYYTDTLNNWIDWTVLHYTSSDSARLTIVNETDTYYEVNFFDLLDNPVQHYIWGGCDGNLDGISKCYQNELTSDSFRIYKDFETRHYSVFSGEIYNSDGTLFFPRPPQVTLMRPTQVEEIPSVITKILIILIPVGLIIFGTLCLVYLLSSKKWLHL